MVYSRQRTRDPIQRLRDPTVRDRYIAQIRSNGRMAWQLATGYNQRSRIETQIGRWKSVIGPKLKSRSFSRQITEIQVGQKVLNTMTALGRPVFECIARRYRLGKGEFHLHPDPCNNAYLCLNFSESATSATWPGSPRSA